MRTEYLRCFNPDNLEDSLKPDNWSVKKEEAEVFPSHAVADTIAARMREALTQHRRETGEIPATFVHARTLSLEELDANRRIIPERAAPVPWPKATAKTEPEPEPEIRRVSLDPARWGEIQRDPKD